MTLTTALQKALVEAVLPLEVIAAQDRAKPYVELSRDFIDSINAAIGIVRAALDASRQDEGQRVLVITRDDLDRALELEFPEPTAEHVWGHLEAFTEAEA